MRLLIDLFENPTTDVAASQSVDRLYYAIYNYLHDRQDTGFTLPDLVMDDEEMPCLPLWKIPGVDPKFNDVILAFKSVTSFHLSGRHAHLGIPVNNVRHIVTLEVPKADGVSEVMSSFYSDRVRTNFYHEMQHVLDGKRFKGDRFKDGDSDNMPSNETDLDNYHNSDSELNAYFHNLAEPLLHRLRFIDRDGIEAVELFAPLPRDFRTWLKTVPGARPGAIRQHWQHLTPENRKKAIRRLYGLFTHYWDMIDRAAPFAD